MPNPHQPQKAHRQKISKSAEREKKTETHMEVMGRISEYHPYRKGLIAVLIGDRARVRSMLGALQLKRPKKAGIIRFERAASTHGGRKPRANVTRAVHWQKVFVDDDVLRSEEREEAAWPADKLPFSHGRLHALRAVILAFETFMIPLRVGLPQAFLNSPLFIALDVLADSAELTVVTLRLWPLGGRKERDKAYAAHTRPSDMVLQPMRHLWSSLRVRLGARAGRAHTALTTSLPSHRRSRAGTPRRARLSTWPSSSCTTFRAQSFSSQALMPSSLLRCRSCAVSAYTS